MKLALISLLMPSLAAFVVGKSGIEILSAAVDLNDELVFCSMLFYPFTYPDTESEYGRSFVLFSTQSSNNSDLQNRLIQGMSNADIGYTKISVSDLVRRPHATQKFVNRIRVYVLVIDAIDVIDATIKSWQQRKSWNPLAIVFSIVNFATTPAIIKSVLEIFFAHKMVNVYVVYEDDSDYKLASWLPYNNGRCADHIEDIVVLDECRPNIFDKIATTMVIADPQDAPKPTNLLSNYHSCPLNVSASVWEPFVVYNESETGDRKWDGIEVLILRAVATHLNMTTNFILNNESRSDRTVNIGKGLYSPLLREYGVNALQIARYLKTHMRGAYEAQLMIGGLVKDPNILLSFAESMPYINDDHAWCLQRASQSASWENIFQVFRYDMWIAILITLLLMSVLLYAFIRFEHLSCNFSWALLRGLALSISAPPFLWPTPHFSIRLIFFVFLTYGVIINIAFSSFLVNALTKQRFTKQIDTINETIQHGFVYVGGPVVYDSLASRGDPVSWQIRNRFSVCENLNACLQSLRHERLLAVASSLMHMRSYRPLEDADIFCMPGDQDRIFDYPVTIIVQPNFHLLPAINSIILRLIEHGIICKWHNDNVSLRMRQKNEERRVYDENFANGLPQPQDKVIILTISHVSGSIIILFAGNCIATIVFLIEIVVDRRMRSNHAYQRVGKQNGWHRRWFNVFKRV